MMIQVTNYVTVARYAMSCWPEATVLVTNIIKATTLRQSSGHVRAHLFIP